MKTLQQTYCITLKKKKVKEKELKEMEKSKRSCHDINCTAAEKKKRDDDGEEMMPIEDIF